MLQVLRVLLVCCFRGVCFCSYLVLQEIMNRMKKPSSPLLHQLGYDFVDGKLVKSNGEGFRFTTQKVYDELGQAVTSYLYEEMEKSGLRKIELNSSSRSLWKEVLLNPLNFCRNPTPQESTSDSFFFASHEVAVKKCQRILILIHGSGAVRAGQWSRSIIINDSLKEGSQLPFIKEANNQDYGVIVTNGNQTSPEDHAISVWENLITKSLCEHVIIVAHSYGGQVTMELARRFPQDFADKVKKVFFTDSAHYGMTGMPPLDQRISKISVNYVASDLPRNTPMTPQGLITCVSSGTPSHEKTSWFAFPMIFEEIRKLDGGPELLTDSLL